jgi:4-alpha-glucanotransferase
MQQSRKRRTRTSPDAGAGCLFVLLAIGIAVYFFTRRPDAELPESLEQQLSVLDRSAHDLAALSQFVEEQKQTLRDQEGVIQALRNEQQTLEPAIQADRRTINAILAADAKRREDQVWASRAEGFLLGVLSSLVASGLIHWVQRRRRPPTTDSPPTSD